jgi:hypothetical protein
MHRAEIFYNHVYFSEVAPTQRARLAKREVYERIINHDNYSPRLLEQALIEATQLPPDQEVDIGEVVLRNLTNPRHLWERMVEHVLTADERALILVLYTANRRAMYDRVNIAWRAHLRLNTSADSDRRFRRAVHRLSSTMVRIADAPNGQYVAFHNPSIRDFLHGYLSGNREVLGSLFETAVYSDQLTTLWSTATGRPHSDELHTTVKDVSDKLRNAVVWIGATTQTLVLPEHQARMPWARLVIELGEIAYRHELGALGVDLIDRLDSWTYGASGLADIADLLGNSTVPEWCSRAEKTAEMACETALSDIIDWESATEASEVIEDLERQFPEIAK